MKRALFAVLMLLTTINAMADSTYQVTAIYQSVVPGPGTMALDQMGNLVEVDELLVPAHLQAGTYDIHVTRIDTNLYKIDGRDFYIQTSLCLELALSEEAYLKVGGIFSQLTFVGGY